MSIPDKNNPDGMGSYGKSPSRFVERPREKAEAAPNDATQGPLGSAAADQEVFDQVQRDLSRKPAPRADPPMPAPPGKQKRVTGVPDNKSPEVDEA